VAGVEALNVLAPPSAAIDAAFAGSNGWSLENV
jgi:hypothetical protein